MVAVCDDDQIYPTGWLSHMLDVSREFGYKKAVGFSGFVQKEELGSKKDLSLEDWHDKDGIIGYKTWNKGNNRSRILWPQGYTGYLLPAGVFDHSLLNVNNYCLKLLGNRAPKLSGFPPDLPYVPDDPVVGAYCDINGIELIQAVTSSHTSPKETKNSNITSIGQSEDKTTSKHGESATASLYKLLLQKGFFTRRHQFGISDLFDDQLQPLGERHLSSMQYLYDNALNITGDAAKIEGNLYTRHQSSQRHPQWKLRRMAKIAKNPRITSYLEVGVNAGHSLMNVLLAGKAINKVLLFDLAAHSYMKPNLKYIRNQFPHVDITLVEGDSTKTIPRTPVRHKFDMIHIDGGHSRKIAYSDIINCRSFAHADSILIIDDCEFNEQETCLGGAVKQCIDEGIIKIYCCDGSKGEHIIGRYIDTT